MPIKNILIVEDEEAISGLIQILLRKSGYGISGTADTGEGAIKEAERTRPDLIMMDIQLKGRMDGVEAAEQIRSRFGIPVIYLTAFSDDTILSRAKTTGPMGYIIKPFEERELLVAVEMALYRHNTEQMLQKKARLNELLLDSLPCPAMLVHKERSIVAANRIVREMGVKYNDPCWSVCRINLDTKHPDESPVENVPDKGNRDSICSYCRADEALSTGRSLSSHGVETLGKFWDITWIPLEDDVFLHYAIDVTPYKLAEETLKKAQDDLENRVRERTKELSEANDQLQNEISMRKDGERKIKQSQKMLQSIFDGITDPLMILGPDMSVMLSNTAAHKYYRISDPEGYKGGLCYNLVRGRQSPCNECMVPTVMASVIKRNEPAIFERPGFMDADRIEQVTIYPVPASDDDTTGVIIRICDVTEAKKMQMSLIQNEKLAALGLLVSSIAHEINNPNNLITFNIPIMRDYITALLPIIDEYAEAHPDFSVFNMSYPEFREDVFKLLDNIEQGSSRINCTISGLKEFVRVDDPMKKTQTNLKSVIQKGISICSSQVSKRVKRLIVDVPENLPPVFINSKALEQVLINLLVNAAQAADKNDSWIKISVPPGKSSNGDWSIEVSDNGCGVNETTKKKIFEPFFTTKGSKEGTGLGLYVSRTLIEGLGGRINLRSEIGKGSTFQIILPGGDK